jgi:ABC-2 type transport system ATP-binding protein
VCPWDDRANLRNLGSTFWARTPKPAWHRGFIVSGACFDPTADLIYTTHHMDEAEARCDRVAVINAGAVVAMGSPRDLIGGSTLPTRVLVPAGRITLERARQIDGADRVTVEDGSVVIETRAAGRALSAVGQVVGLDGIQTRTVTLEDIYLQLTGELTGAEG